MIKVVNISAVASPHMVRFIPFMRQKFDAEFYFYEALGGRQAWWAIDLGEHGHILDCWFKWKARYLTFSVLGILRKNNPDVVMLGGFAAPSNYLAYVWARLHKKKVIVFTERSRNHKTGKLYGYNWYWKMIHFLYRNIDMVMTTSVDIVPQFRDTFHFGEKVVGGQYPSDLDRYYSHPLRGKKDSYTIIFPNSMTERYNPLGAVEIFHIVQKRYPKTKMKMNASGEMRHLVKRRIRELGLLDSVEILDYISNWDELGQVYASCDIMLLPAIFSNGNYTISECAVSGMGCVISDKILGESAEILKTTGSGVVIPLDNMRFAEEICNYIEHPELIDKAALINREAFQHRTLKGTAEMYERLITALG